MRVIAVLPQGLEQEGAKELFELGATSIKPLKRSVFFEADLACFYRVHIRARLPFRFLKEISRFNCYDSHSLYIGVQTALDSDLFIHPAMTFRVDVSGHNQSLSHSHFTALQVKNAIVDFQRASWGQRSDIELEDPDICLHLHLSDREAILSFDTSAKSLHKRGYRAALGLAPLKENLAAGLIRTTSWEGSTPLVDPLCGSATLLIEAVSIALGTPPRINNKFLFESWSDFNLDIWNKEKHRAEVNDNQSIQLPLIIGCEENKEVADQAKSNISDAGLDQYIKIENKHFREMTFPDMKGLIVCNPPYGKRVGKDLDLMLLYQELGSFLKKNASGWDMWLLNGNVELGRELQMKSRLKIPISNGGIDCRWLNYQIH